MAGKLQSPEKELRFTRSGQAAVFWVIAAVLARLRKLWAGAAPGSLGNLGSSEAQASTPGR